MAKTMENSSLAVKESKAPESQLTPEAIALRAYEIYLERGGEPGHELEDWTRAEKELSGKNGKSKRKTSLKPIAA